MCGGLMTHKTVTSAQNEDSGSRMTVDDVRKVTLKSKKMRAKLAALRKRHSQLKAV